MINVYLDGEFMNYELRYDYNIIDYFFTIKDDDANYDTTNKYQELLLKQVKGNISIDKKILNKYSSVMEIFNNIYNYNNKVLKLNNNYLPDLNLVNIKSQEMYSLLKNVFKKYHYNNIFINNGNKIIVSNRDIKHTVTYIYKTPGQKKMLREHIIVIENLGQIIKHAKLINQSGSKDIDSEDNSWHYYYDNLNINNQKYVLVFDVVSRNNGENHYRVQRLQKK